jgi:hypothetical protein
MVENVVGWILNRIRQFGNRFSGTFGNAYRVMYAGTIVKMNYSNYKHDPNPLIFVLYSGVKYTHGLNLNYLNFQEKQYLGRLIYALKRGNQVIDGHTLYLILKRDVYYSLVRKCYRTYFSNLIMSPKMVSSGYTPLNRLVYPYNDPFIVALNKYVNNENLGYTAPVQVAYYPQELRDRINMAIHSVPIGTQSATVSATTPTIRNV